LRDDDSGEEEDAAGKAFRNEIGPPRRHLNRAYRAGGRKGNVLRCAGRRLMATDMTIKGGEIATGEVHPLFNHY
jgi:hypothetical protein